VVRRSTRGYVPERGDCVWLTFDPQAGHEQTGRRPALILSPGIYNRRAGLALACPITNQIKGYPFEVVLPNRIPISGAVLSDQLKSIDWRARKVQFACRAPGEVVGEVTAKLSELLRI
jgi:mRNA interferase MazF